MSVSENVKIMTQDEYDRDINEAFQRGVERGRFAEWSDILNGVKPLPKSAINELAKHCETDTAGHV